MRNFIKVIIFVCLFGSCNIKSKQELIKDNGLRLSKTKWECKIADGCINFYEFQLDSSYIFYSCEMEDEYFGDYFFRGDTLILDRKGSIYDKEFPANSIHRAERRLYEIFITDDELKHLNVSDLVNGKWVKSDFKFDDTFFYKKVDQK